MPEPGQEVLDRRSHMVDTVSRRGQDLNRFQHIAIPSVNLCSFTDPARVYQQCDMRIVQTDHTMGELREELRYRERTQGCLYRTRIETTDDLMAWCWCWTKSGRHTLLSLNVVSAITALTLRKIGMNCICELIGRIRRPRSYPPPLVLLPLSLKLDSSRSLDCYWSLTTTSEFSGSF